MAANVNPRLFTPTVVVASKADAVDWQYLAAHVHNAGVMVADARSLGATYVFALAINSGGNASLAAGGVQKAIASEAILRGQFLKPTSATGLVSVTSGGDSLAFATAWGTAAGSGELFAIQVGR